MAAPGEATHAARCRTGNALFLLAFLVVGLNLVSATEPLWPYAVAVMFAVLGAGLRLEAALRRRRDRER